QVGAALPVTKAAWLAESVATLGDDIARALALATSGRPGPVHVSLPGDVLEAMAVNGPRPIAQAQPATTDLSVAAVRETIGLLAGARNPLIITGPAMGRGKRWRGVAALAELTQIPALVMESPRGVNDPSLRAAAACLAEADVVLLLGKKLDYTLRFGRPPAFAPDIRFV